MPDRVLVFAASPRRVLAGVGTLLIVGVIVANIAIGQAEFHHEPRSTKDLLGAFVLLGVGMLAVSFVWMIALGWQERHPSSEPARYRKPGRS